MGRSEQHWTALCMGAQGAVVQAALQQLLLLLLPLLHKTLLRPLPSQQSSLTHWVVAHRRGLQRACSGAATGQLAGCCVQPALAHVA